MVTTSREILGDSEFKEAYLFFTQNFFQKHDRYFIWYSMKQTDLLQT